MPEFDMLLRRQVLIVSSATSNWDAYIDYLEEEYAEMVSTTATWSCDTNTDERIDATREPRCFSQTLHWGKRHRARWISTSPSATVRTCTFSRRRSHVCWPHSSRTVKRYTCYTRSCGAKQSSTGVDSPVHESCPHSIPSKDSCPSRGARRRPRNAMWHRWFGASKDLQNL